MAQIVYLAPRGGLPMVDELTRAGHIVWEALAISEVLNLLENERVDIVIVAPEIQDQRTTEIKARITTLLLAKDTSAFDVVWEISNLFSETSKQIQ